jgi:hypothetical protein
MALIMSVPLYLTHHVLHLSHPCLFLFGKKKASLDHALSHPCARCPTLPCCLLTTCRRHLYTWTPCLALRACFVLSKNLFSPCPTKKLNRTSCLVCLLCCLNSSASEFFLAGLAGRAKLAHVAGQG